ncbi:hypothetical protein SNOG_12183 [Parastagonospora nodorum SN15]|uniref:Uncharacterized protein n=1 Tax=Phaeosphaeria nodorum (strain SN15 / ATCC MYA-4574 / FGSC 10173) TaxID=321614 RepID=Q0U7T1_PHANO|nr:hypothetical protein SNOG_12183 [Parastagonospora nodorum SN15]EAT80595.1 hypothetical protein SNOG_12183 [Parastagonospora nodorum SN15]
MHYCSYARTGPCQNRQLVNSTEIPELANLFILIMKFFAATQMSRLFAWPK